MRRRIAARATCLSPYTPLPRRCRVIFGGSLFSAQVGRERKAEYEKDYVLTGMWQKYVFPARVPVIPKNKATGSDDDEGTSYDSSDDGSDEEGREWVPLEKR